jgi:hypothetical protein
VVLVAVTDENKRAAAGDVAAAAAAAAAAAQEMLLLPLPLLLAPIHPVLLLLLRVRSSLSSETRCMVYSNSVSPLANNRINGGCDLIDQGVCVLVQSSESSTLEQNLLNNTNINTIISHLCILLTTSRESLNQSHLPLNPKPSSFISVCPTYAIIAST